MMGYSNVQTAFLLLVIGALVTGVLRSWRTAGWLATIIIGAATVLAWVDGVGVLLKGSHVKSVIAPLPGFGSELAVSLDPLGAGFLLLVSAVSLIAAIYSIGYMGSYRNESPRRFYSLLQLFIAGMMGVVSVSDWLFFIVFWELMTLASYFLVTFERTDPHAVRAGFKYFIMTHVATAGLLVAAVVLWGNTGSFGFTGHKTGLALMSPALRDFLLALYLLAFATKAGIFPMGDWLPDAHPAAPSGVSAILSGVMIKLGAYGVLRVFWETLPGIGSRVEILTWGTVIAFLGVLSAFVGGLTAMKENDSKRLLAFSSISQTGYIFLALGIAVAFSASPELRSLALIALIAGGFHILNDALYKSLLFMNAGSILYSTGTRDLNTVGGLWTVMPAAATAGLVGVLSLSGLPPMNGFASKWLIYQSSVSGALHFAPFVAAVVLAFFVSLATLAYSLKYFNTAFLGKPAAQRRSPIPIPVTMTVGQVIPALACVVIGLIPAWALKAVASVFDAAAGDTFVIGRLGGISPSASAGAIPAAWSPIVFIAILALCFIGAEVIRRSGKAATRSVPSWYGGEEHPDDEVRFRAQGFYSPFNEAFAKVYPHIPLPRLPSLQRLRRVLDLDWWLYGPVTQGGGKLVDKVARSHGGIPQMYMVWQVAGMVLVLVLLFVIIR